LGWPRVGASDQFGVVRTVATEQWQERGSEGGPSGADTGIACRDYQGADGAGVSGAEARCDLLREGSGERIDYQSASLSVGVGERVLVRSPSETYYVGE